MILLRKWRFKVSILLLCELLLLNLYWEVAAGSLSTTTSYTDVARNVYLDVKVVLIGFPDGFLNESYQKWLNPSYKYQSILIPGVSSNVIFNFNYSFISVSEGFTEAFIDYLDSISKIERRFNIFTNTSYYYVKGVPQANSSNIEVETTNTLYDADKVLEWLKGRSGEYGGFPENGYTLFLADLSRWIPSVSAEQYAALLDGENVEITPHYYNITNHDVDRGLTLNRRYMTSWGGDNRLYYIDLSAGPSMVDRQLPIQIAVSRSGVELESNYGYTWLNQFIADYVYGPINNLFATDLIYPLNYADKYRIKILVIDNRTRGTSPPIEETLDVRTIKEVLEELLSFSTVEVEVNYQRLEDAPSLKKVVSQSTNEARGRVETYPPQVIYPPNFVDLMPIYHWLSSEGEGHLSELLNVTRNEEVFDIPVLVFSFQRDFHFGFNYKEWIFDVFPETRDFWGVALYDMAVIGFSEADFKWGDYLSVDPQPGKGFGFTQTIIHEIGHMLGLNHPFIYDPTQDFVSSVMGYYTYDYGFSQFDKDTIHRGLADKLLKEAKTLSTEISKNPLAYLKVYEVEGLLGRAEDMYDEMNYTLAIKYAREAVSRIGSLDMASAMLPPLFFIAAAFLVGVIIGYFASRYVSLKKHGKKQYCMRCGAKL